ncbi:competence/damage-inducible protein A [Fusibacillus kribbianus]|uniref:Putative competence-damage inducible protein n=1 Tax=Fusibacillus kribbianus TaxID=3044208 RepID=A0AAP4EXE0_9FIRM|nr:competence/damage-inducible protein A [Ruminococcus sp. YH-rum2234]MDI9241692.1 competence/damage-inducible protein A [Ruminococcus sp. YH-rum2234]
MDVEILAVGTELLLGNIANTNAQYLSQKCANLGLSVYHHTVVGDNETRMTDAICRALDRSDIVILTGGLGPTEDDMTKEVCAKVMGFELAEDPHTKERIAGYFKISGRKNITENNWKQAVVPVGAKVLDNSNGTAPGLILEKDGKTAILLPGPPNELKPLFEEQVAPYLRSLQPETIYSQMVKVCGIGESRAETMILDLINSQTNPTIATYAKTGEVHLRVTAKAESEEQGKKLVKPVVKELKNRFGINIYTTDEEESLEDVVVRLLRKYGLTVTTAESMTGGLLAGRIVNVAGASECFKEGFITYSNKAKRKFLDVSKATLKKYGAVSEQTAKEMAKGGIFAADSDICVAVTGFAGPEDSPEEPRGLTYISCYIDDKVFVKEFHFTGNRMKIREQAVVQALDLLRRCIIEQYK